MNYKIEPRTDTKRTDGLFQFRLKLGTGNHRKFIPLNIVADPAHWDTKQEMFLIDPRAKSREIRELNDRYREYNALIGTIKRKCRDILHDFERDNIIPTATQFIECYNGNIGRRALIAPYFEQRIKVLQETGHIGNANCYKRTLLMLRLYDNKFDRLFFNDITVRYINQFDIWLQKRSCNGNTRKYYHKALRALLNYAIREKVADDKTYPYGKGGFEVGKLEESTAKRYLPMEVMQKIKKTELDDSKLEVTRRIFVAQYLCYGISWIDAGYLTRRDIKQVDGTNFIVYKRQKTKNAKKVMAITIPITSELQSHFDWFSEHCRLVGDFLFPIVSKDGYVGEELYRHIRNRFVRNNKNLKDLAKAFGITDLSLTSYVSRHTMAMTLQKNEVPREIISQVLGHSDLAVTMTYLDSFNVGELAKATKVL